MHWLFLIIAIILEVSGTTSMKLSKGFKELIPSVMIFVFYGFSFVALTLALKKIDISVAYAIWSGIGIFLIALIGIVWFKEPVDLLKMVFMTLILIGVVGVKLVPSAST